MKRTVSLLLALCLSLFLFAGTGASLLAEQWEAIPSVSLESGAHAYTRQEWMRTLGLTSAQLDSLINKVHDDIRHFRSESNVASYGIRYSDEVNLQLSSLLFDEDPTLFMINQCTYYRSNATNLLQKITFDQKDYMAKSEYDSLLQKSDRAASTLLEGIVGSSLNDVQKALLLHDRLALWCEYDYQRYLDNTVPSASHMMYGPLANRIAVCDGYAKAYTYLLAKVGIDSSVVRSKQLDHAWNVVNIGGRYYHVDVTWDDPNWDVPGRVLHKNFLLSTAALRETGHTANDYDATPSDTHFDSYFWKEEECAAAFQYLKGDIYYITGNNVLMRWDLQKNALSRMFSTAGNWGRYRGYSRLLSDETYLYYSTGDGVYRYDVTRDRPECIYTLDSARYPGRYVVGMEQSGKIMFLNIWEHDAFQSYSERSVSRASFRYMNIDVVRIAVRTKPDKTAFCPGSEPTTAGLSVMGYYNDGDTFLIDPKEYQVSSFTTDSLGEKVITVNYKDLTASFSVYVTDKPGDVDGNGTISTTDARLALQRAVGKLGENVVELQLGDVDGDGKISTTDARLILQYAVGKIDRFPVEPEPVKELSEEERQAFCNQFCSLIADYRRTYVSTGAPMAQDVNRLQAAARAKSADLAARDELAISSPAYADQYDLVRRFLTVPEEGRVGILLYKADFTSLTPQEAFDYLMSAEDTRNVMLLQDFFVCAAAVDGDYFTLLLTSFPTW